MLRLRKYLFLQLKTGMKCLISLLISFLLIASLFAMGIISYQFLKEDAEQKNIIHMGIVVSENDVIFHQLLPFLNGLESIQSFCDIEFVSQEEGFRGLQAGTLQFVAVIPEDFYEEAVRCEETQFTVYVGENLSKREWKVLSLLKAVEESMQIAESAIFSMEEGIDEYQLSISKGEVEYDLTEIYIMEILFRNQAFKRSNISFSGSFSFAEYYVADICLVWILLHSLVFLKLYGKEEKMIENLIAKGQMGKIGTSLSKVMTLTLTLYIVMGIGLLMGDVVCQFMNHSFLMAHGMMYLYLLPLSFCMAAWIHFFFSIGTEQKEKGMFFVLVLFVMVLLSGGIVPIIYLPNMLRGIVQWIPFHQWHNWLQHILWGEITGSMILRMLLLGCVGVLLTHLINRRKC